MMETSIIAMEYVGIDLLISNLREIVVFQRKILIDRTYYGWRLEIEGMFVVDSLIVYSTRGEMRSTHVMYWSFAYCVEYCRLDQLRSIIWTLSSGDFRVEVVPWP